MNPGFWNYFKAAFNARPIGMFIPPNWVAIAAIAMAGLLNPGLWIVGLGAELGYLYAMVNSARFRRVVDGQITLQKQNQWQTRLDSHVDSLTEIDQGLYTTLQQRCRTILNQQRQTADAPTSLAAQAEGLSKLLWVYLKLLLTRQSIRRVLAQGSTAPGHDLDDRITQLDAQLAKQDLDSELRRSLTGQSDILKQRQAKQQEARQKFAFLDAELTRVQEQVELIREQAALSADPEAISQRIDEIGATLGGTTRWITQQQQLYGHLEDILADAPAVAIDQGLMEKSK